MEIIKINEDDFKKEVLNSKEKVLVDFNADWCGPCKMLHATLEEMEDADYKVVSVNVDDNENLSREYGVMSIPCLIVFKDGKEVSRSIGFKTALEIEEMIGE